MGTLAALWAEQAAGNVVGVALAENAAQVLAAEGVPQAFNIARFLARAARGEQLLAAGDLLIVDEAGMVPTAQLTALHHLAQEAGAVIYPAMPALYSKPQSTAEMARQFVDRVLAHIGLPQPGAYQWKGD